MSATKQNGGLMPPKREVKTDTYSGRVSARVRKLREAKGWLVSDLTAAVNRHLPEGSAPIAKSTMHGWENGNRKIDPDAYPFIARAFGLTLREFLPAK